MYSNRGPLVPSARGGQMGLGKPSAPTWFERRRRALAGRQRVPPVQAGHIEDTFSLRMGFCFEAVPDEGTIRSPHWHGCRRWQHLSWFGFRLLKTDRISEERHSTSPHHENRWWVVFRLEVCLLMHFFGQKSRQPTVASNKIRGQLVHKKFFALSWRIFYGSLIINTILTNSSARLLKSHGCNGF